MYFGLQVNGQWFVSHCDSEKEVWDEVDGYYAEKYPHIDFRKNGKIVTHNDSLKW